MLYAVKSKMKNLLFALKQNLLVMGLGVFSVILVSVGLFFAFHTSSNQSKTPDTGLTDQSGLQSQSTAAGTGSGNTTNSTTTTSGSTTPSTTKTTTSSKPSSTTSTSSSSTGSSSTGGSTTGGSTGGSTSGGGGGTTPPPPCTPLSVTGVTANNRTWPNEGKPNYTFPLSASVSTSGNCSTSINYSFHMSDGTSSSGSKTITGNTSVSAQWTLNTCTNGTYYVTVSWSGGTLTSNTASATWTSGPGGTC